MQTSTAPDVKHPLPLAKSTLSVAAQHRRPSLGYLFAPLNVKTPETSTPSTNRLILDYLLFISIQSRLRQADIGLYHDASEDEDEDALKRWTEAGTRANKDHIAVESIIHGKRGINFSTRLHGLEKITWFFLSHLSLHDSEHRLNINLYFITFFFYRCQIILAIENPTSIWFRSQATSSSMSIDQFCVWTLRFYHRSSHS